MPNNVYDAITEAHDDESRWAFGTGFDDPLSGMDTSVPAGVDAAELAARCVALGDDALVFSHRLQEWVTRLPELEDEVAVANIALDLLGQSRLLLARAGRADGTDRGEDDFAFTRAESEFRNVRLAELAGGHFGDLIARLLIFSTWRLAEFTALRTDPDPVLAAIADKAVKELTYHRDYAAGWAVRLGDGTEVSAARMQGALDALWPYVEELFTAAPATRSEVDGVLEQVFTAGGLRRPEAAARVGVAGRTGRDGVHTEVFGYLVAELQSVARAHPGATW